MKNEERRMKNSALSVSVILSEAKNLLKKSRNKQEVLHVVQDDRTKGILHSSFFILHLSFFIPYYMKFSFILFFLAAFLLSACGKQTDAVTLTIINSLDVERRGEIVEVPLADLTRKAVALVDNGRSDAENIRQLGEGWTAEEAWAIALYCAIRHADSAENAIIAAVNHDGDSDSTGSICGNIMGAIHGYEAISRQLLFCPQGKKLEQVLELSNIILTLADDLYTSCIISEYDPIDTLEKRQWYERYCEMKPAGI